MDVHSLKMPGPNAFALRKASNPDSNESDAQKSPPPEDRHLRPYLLSSQAYAVQTPSQPHPGQLVTTPSSGQETPFQGTPEFEWNFSKTPSSSAQRSSHRDSARRTAHGRNLSFHQHDERLFELVHNGGGEHANIRKKGPPPALNLNRAADAGKTLYGGIKAYRPEPDPPKPRISSSSFGGLRKFFPVKPSPPQQQKQSEVPNHHLGIAPKAAQLLGAGSQQAAAPKKDDPDSSPTDASGRQPGKTASRFPQKAAKILGTSSSAPSSEIKPAKVHREKSLPKLGDFPQPAPEDALSPHTPSPLIRVRRSDGDEVIDKPKSLHALNARLASQSRKEHYEHLRYMNDDTPPTPPSKSESLLRRASQARRVVSEDAIPSRRQEALLTPEPSDYHHVTTGSPEVVHPPKSQLPVSATGSIRYSESRHVASQVAKIDAKQAVVTGLSPLSVQHVQDFHGYPSIVGGNPYSPSCYAFPEDARQLAEDARQPDAEGKKSNANTEASSSAVPEIDIAQFEHGRDNTTDTVASLGHSANPSVSATEIIEMYRYTANDAGKLYPSPLHIPGPSFQRAKLYTVKEEQRGALGSPTGTVQAVKDANEVEQLCGPSSAPPVSPSLRRKSGFDSRTGSPVLNNRRVAEESPFSLPMVSKMLQPTPDSSTFGPHTAHAGDPQKVFAQEKPFSKLIDRLTELEEEINRMKDTDSRPPTEHFGDESTDPKIQAHDLRLKTLEQNYESVHSISRSLHEKQAQMLKTQGTMGRKHNDFSSHVVLSLNRLNDKIEQLRDEVDRNTHDIRAQNEYMAKLEAESASAFQASREAREEVNTLRASVVEFERELAAARKMLFDDQSSLRFKVLDLEAQISGGPARIGHQRNQTPARKLRHSDGAANISSTRPDSGTRGLDPLKRSVSPAKQESPGRGPSVPRANSESSMDHALESASPRSRNGPPSVFHTRGSSNSQNVSPVRPAHPLDLSPQTRLAPSAAPSTIS